MKIFKYLLVIPVITLIIVFQTSLQNRYLMASDIRDGETIFRNVCAGCHVRGGSVVLKGSKSLKLSDLEKRGIADVNSIAEIANEGITLEYDSGNSRTTLELIQSRSLLLEARISNANAERNFIISQFQLLKEIGNLDINIIKNT